jgi:hypothetical protein
VSLYVYVSVCVKGAGRKGEPEGRESWRKGGGEGDWTGGLCLAPSKTWVFGGEIV